MYYDDINCRSDYTPGKFIDRGGYGTVIRVNRGDREYAGKLLFENINTGIEDIIEIDILSRLRHPNLMYNIDIVPWPKMSRRDRFCDFAIILPLASMTLHQYSRNKDLEIDQLIQLMFELVTAVDFLHHNRVLHMDIKPHNVLIFMDNNRPKAVLSDFGLAILSNDNGTRYYQRELVTITYRAPELFKQKYYYSTKVDIWSLGITFLEILRHGRYVFDRTITYQTIYNLFNDSVRSKTIAGFLNHISSPYLPDIIDLLDKMLAINPKERPGTTTILKSPLFRDFRQPLTIEQEVGIVEPDIEYMEECTIFQYRAFDDMVRIAEYQNVKIEVVFLAADLFHRVMSLSPPLIPNIAQTWKMIILVMMTCYWIANKMIEYAPATSTGIAKFNNNIFSADQLLQLEQLIIQRLNGVIYRSNFFTHSPCYHRLQEAFELLRNCYIYSRIDLEDWLAQSHPSCKQYDTDIRFQSFYKQTEYYEYISSHLNRFIAISKLFAHEKSTAPP